ncbi:MAG: polysaccharide pyruvyl transferase family protein [Sphingobium sp.]
MKLYYYQAPEGNFGDDLNGWLWEELVPGIWDKDDGSVFCGIGTIIGNEMPAASRVTVFSSGIGYRPPPTDFATSRWKVLALRGPLTARILNQPEHAVADGALLLSTLPRLAPVPQSERRGVIFIPHYEAMTEGAWDHACLLAGVTLVDPRSSAHEVIDRIRHSRLVIADSMHAAIIADAMRVPWVPVVSSQRINSFKWLDWTLSLDLPYEPTPLPAISLSAAYGSAVQPLYGRGYRLRRADPSRAIDHYHRSVRRDQSGWWRAVQPKLKHYLTTAPNRLPASPLLRHYADRRDGRQVERVAAALEALKDNGGYMSGARIFGERVEQLQARLATVQ